ncbi:MAG: GTPase Era [Candidatus Omnitrophota bacterium]
MQENFKSGFVCMLGRPNVGKSSILNYLVGNKISIVSAIPQTTRYQIKGILNLNGAQIVFVDTPGIHSFKDDLARHLNTIAKKSIEGCDLLIYVVDVSRKIGKEEGKAMDLLASQRIKIIMALNKIDLGAPYINDYINHWSNIIKNRNIKDTLVYYFPISAKTGQNMGSLQNAIVDNLPNQHPFYDKETLTDFPLKFRAAEIIREKLFLKLKKEVPHSLAVEIENIEDKDKVTVVEAVIYVNRVSQKKIVIGEKGNFIKQVGIESRKEIETIVNKKVYIDIRVKVLSDWQKSPRVLKELGYWWA